MSELVLSRATKNSAFRGEVVEEGLGDREGPEHGQVRARDERRWPPSPDGLEGRLGVALATTPRRQGSPRDRDPGTEAGTTLV